MSEILSWADSVELQPEPITLEIWQQLPEEFCRQVEVVNGQAVHCESPWRLHQKMVWALTGALEAAAQLHTAEGNDCLDAEMDFDVLLWELPPTQIRRPDVALHRCAPNELSPLPAHMLLIAVEVLSDNEKVDTVGKRAEYAVAGIPWYWLVALDEGGVSSIEILALDHGLGCYKTMSTVDSRSGDRLPGPIPIKLDWPQLRVD